MKRVLIVTAVTSAAHLSLIPINALYGVHICPVLGGLGFGFGCKYTAALIAYILAADAIFAAVSGWICVWYQRALRQLPAVFFVGHWIAFLTGMRLLTDYLTGLHVPALTLEKMNTAYTYAAILITILQFQAADWAVTGFLRARLAAKNPVSDAKCIKNLTGRWLVASFFKSIPFIGVVAVIAIFMNTKVMEVAEMPAVTAEAIQKITMESAQVIGMLLAWLGFIHIFSFLKEKELVDNVNKHLEALGRLDATHFSSTAASGFWEDIFLGLNKTTDLIGQRARLVKGFATYVTHAVAENILKGEGKTDGRLQKLTIMATDLRDFTRMSSTMRAEDVVRVLNIYFTDMLEIMTEFGATVDKFIGDGILAYIEPQEGETIEQCNVKGAHLAIAMHERLKETNHKLATESLPTLKLGVGVHWGEVVIGSIGAPTKMQYTVIGDTVNVTARLESLCKPLETGIVISDCIYRALDETDKAFFKDMGPQEIKGISGKPRVYAFNSAEPATKPSLKTG